MSGRADVMMPEGAMWRTLKQPLRASIVEKEAIKDQRRLYSAIQGQRLLVANLCAL